MKITKRTRVKDITPLIRNEETMKRLIESFPPYPLEKNILSMTIGEFCELTIDESGYINRMLDPKQKAYIAFGRLKEYSNQMKVLTKFLEGMSIQMTADEKMASQNVDMPSTAERILLDTVKAYHLHSTKEAEQLPITDWILVLKDSVATAKYSRNYQKILEQKSKMKSKRK